MSKQLPDVKSIVIRIITDKPVRKTAYQVKGVFMRQYPNEPIIPMLDGTYRDKFLYPRVQVKVLDEQIYLIGIHEAMDSVLSLSKTLKELNFGNITFEIQDFDIEEYNNQCIVSNNIMKYRFVTPWVALNRITGKKYKFLSNKDKPSFLSKLLGQNLLFLANEFGVTINEDIATKVKVSNLSPKRVDEHKWGSFKGEFITNFKIPNYVGIGNGITRGFGAINCLFDELSSYPEDSRSGKNIKNIIKKEDMEIISASDFKNPKRSQRYFSIKKNKTKRKNKYKKKMGSRFNNKSYQSKSPPIHIRKKSNLTETTNGNILDDDYDPLDDQRFNTEKHHKKQHKF